MSTTKQKIFNTAVDLFSRKGFSGVSVREITRNVGIKESSLYNHYKNKDDILTKIFDYFQTQMQKATPTKQYLQEKIKTIPPEQFWETGLVNFQKATQTPQIQKISKIVLLEMFQNQRARDIALEEFFTRQQKLAVMIFEIMQESNLIGKDNDPKVLALEYTYGMLGLQFEYNILSNWNLPTKTIQEKMLSHIKFISEIAKNSIGGEN
ncbi:MAG: TetR/AcrR family transcriptional regulator [Candidatus Bathyarchaeota archaeon]|jgi:AcrR family transcriptional regulator|nr:TetR/AcrR family transcriptional regulator [Candidatus Bathyarchaeota archaeon]